MVLRKRNWNMHVRVYCVDMYFGSIVYSTFWKEGILVSGTLKCFYTYINNHTQYTCMYVCLNLPMLEFTYACFLHTRARVYEGNILQDVFGRYTSSFLQKIWFEKIKTSGCLIKFIILSFVRTHSSDVLYSLWRVYCTWCIPFVFYVPSSVCLAYKRLKSVSLQWETPEKQWD